MNLPSFFHDWLPLAAILVNGSPASAAFTDRLLSITITDSIGFENDTLSFECDDRDYKLPLLNPGDKIIPLLAILPKGGVVEMGSYTVENADFSEAPATWNIEAQAVDYVNGQLGHERSHTYENKTLKQIADEVASRHGMKAKVDPKLANIKVENFMQAKQSDMDALGEIAQKYGAIAAIKNEEIFIKLPFNGKDIAAASLEAVSIDYRDVSNIKFKQKKRDDAKGITASYVDGDKAKREKITIGQEDGTRELKEIFQNKEQAEAAAQAALTRSQSFKRTLSLTLQGAPELSAEMPITFNHPRVELTGLWITEKVTHRFDGSGYQTIIDCLAPADAAEAIIDAYQGENNG